MLIFGIFFSVDLSAFESLSKTFSSVYGENDANVQALNRILDTVREQQVFAKKKAEEFSKSIKTERENFIQNFQQILEFHHDIVSKLAIEDSNINKNEKKMIPPPPPNEAPPSETYQFLWSKLDDGCSCAEEWRSILSIDIPLPREKMIELFGVAPIEKGKLLSSTSLKKYKSILKETKMSAKQIASYTERTFFYSDRSTQNVDEHFHIDNRTKFIN